MSLVTVTFMFISKPKTNFLDKILNDTKHESFQRTYNFIIANVR